MSPTERAIRTFRERYPMPAGERIHERREMSIAYADLDALYAAVEQEARMAGPMPSWLFGREPNR